MFKKIQTVISHNGVKITIIFFLVATFFTRFYRIRSIPIGVHHDELAYFVQARFLSLKGVGMFGESGLFSLKTFHHKYAELPASVVAVGLKVADAINLPSPINYKFSSLVVGAALPVLLGLFVSKFFHDKQLGVTAAFVAVFNPWLWQISRMSFDALFSLFFYLAAATILVGAKSRRKLYSLPLLIVGFYQYQGLKLLLVPLVVLLSVYNYVCTYQNQENSDRPRWLQSVIDSWPSLLVAFFTVLLTLFYLGVQLPQQSAVSRVKQIIFLDSDLKRELSQTVDTDRRLSLESATNRWFINKYVASFSVVIKKYLSFFNLKELFVQNQPDLSPFSVWKHGLFYVVDLLLIALGIMALGLRKQKLQTLIYGSLLLVSPLPYIISTSNDWRMFRGALTYLLLIPIIALGWQLILKSYQRMLKLTVIGLYVVSVFNFAQQYFIGYPAYASSGLYLESQLAIEYAQRVAATFPKRKVVVATDPFYDYLQLLYSQHIISAKNADYYQQQILNEDHQHNNMSFVKNPDINDFSQKKTLVIIPEKMRGVMSNSQQQTAGNELNIAVMPRLKIVSPLDSGEKILIFNDVLCQEYQLQHFVRFKSLQQLDFEDMNNQQFCQNWIVRQQ